MGKNGLRWAFCILSALLLHKSVCRSQDAEDQRKVYIVYMGALPDAGTYSPTSAHLSILQQVVGEGSVSSSLVRSYKRSFNGFAAMLTRSEAKRLARKDGVVSVFPSGSFRLQTTASWDFVGLNQTAKRNPSVESDVIIGVLDGGAWPESESFSDKGFGPPPRKWKGSCKGGANFTCNNKLIGAQYYTKDQASARDFGGHGTHTASTAAGNAVKGVSFYGLGSGTARGGVPSARIAVYKVCNSKGDCQHSDILAGFDDAIADGVDIITASLGGDIPQSFDTDPVAIGGFHAMERGILTVQSAGNNGPFKGRIASVAPWLFTVGASSTSRGFNTTVILTDTFDWTLPGNTINTFPSMNTSIPIVYGLQVTSTCTEELGRHCNPTCLDREKVRGKIVLCDEANWGIPEAVSKGPAGVIAHCDASAWGPEPFVAPIPLLCFGDVEYESVTSYHNGHKNLRGRILKSKDAKNRGLYPANARFSSLGPNSIVRDIVKPDISAPGLNILAAFSPLASPSSYPSDKRSVKYNFMSGTSMAAPHVAGTAAYIKSFHPDWSPSAIKSAIMTTASPMHLLSDPDASASGNINPAAAVDPGLVFEIETQDYVKFLCNLGYSLGALSSNRSAACSEGSSELSPAKLNYPALSVKVPNMKSYVVALNRTVTNVGLPDSIYKAIVPRLDTRLETQIDVFPKVLRFKSLNEKQTFQVTVSGRLRSGEDILRSKISWVDGKHKVTTPIQIYSMPQ